ncbi:MAG TPA: hypothetical protein VGC50_11175 [Gammaproteobacteria bacterium]
MSDLEIRWAWSQVEGMADGSLSADDERRVRAAMTQDPALRHAVRHAATLRRSLRRLDKAPLPPTLLRHLWGIPGRGKRAGPSAAPLWLSVSACGVAAAAAWLLLPADPAAPDPRAAAVQDFEIAMAYVRQSAVITRDEVTTALGTGLQEAVVTSRDAVRNRDSENDNGG